jgi:tRNA(fMet)-specific endonuclease VapC
MYLLDTNHCSRIIFGDPDLQQRLQSHLNDGAATSVIVQGELLYMVEKSNQQTENLKAVRAFLQIIALYPINGAVADVYGILKGNIVNQLGPKNKTQRRKITIQALGCSNCIAL